jgi:hypothetical protein
VIIDAALRFRGATEVEAELAARYHLVAPGG